MCARVFFKRARPARALQYIRARSRAPARLQKFARSARALERGISTIDNVHLLFCLTKLQNLLIFEKQDTKCSQNYFLHTRGMGKSQSISETVNS